MKVGDPRLTCKRDHIKMRDFTDRRVTPPKRVTSPTWAPHLHVNRPLVTSFMEEMSYVFSFTFFSLPLIFTLNWWPLAFLILSPPLQNFHVVLPTKKCLLCFLSLLLIPVTLFLAELRWPAAHFFFFCLSLALYSKFVDMTIY